ncbi:MAG: protein kinase [bacterium]
MKKIILILQMVLIPFSLFSMKEVSDLDVQSISKETGLKPESVRSMLEQGINPREVLENSKKPRRREIITYQDRLAFDVFGKFKISYLDNLKRKLKSVASGAEKDVMAGRFNHKNATYLFYNVLNFNKLDERFNTELEVLKEFKDSENVIQIFGYDPANKIIVLERASSDLYKYILENEKYKDTENDIQQKIQIRLIETLLNGLKQMHFRGFIHNDLKHKNVVLDKRLNSKLIDFCFSRRVNKKGVFVSDYAIGGSPFYAAPEILPYFDPRYECEFIYSKASDIYALGYILYFIIYGKEHFENETTVEFIEKVKGGWIPELNNESTPFICGMNNIIRRCLQFNPDDRPKIDQIFEMLKDLVAELNSTEQD